MNSGGISCAQSGIESCADYETNSWSDSWAGSCADSSTDTWNSSRSDSCVDMQTDLCAGSGTDSDAVSARGVDAARSATAAEQ